MTPLRERGKEGRLGGKNHRRQDSSTVSARLLGSPGAKSPTSGMGLCLCHTQSLAGRSCWEAQHGWEGARGQAPSLAPGAIHQALPPAEM